MAAVLALVVAMSAHAADLRPAPATFAERFGEWRAIGVFVWTPSNPSTFLRN